MFLGPDNSSSQSVTKRRTGIEPEFNETFIFTMGLDEIPQVSLMFSLKTGNTVVGWFSLGRNFSGAREERQWSVLCETSDVPLRQWQRLCSASWITTETKHLQIHYILQISYLKSFRGNTHLLTLERQHSVEVVPTFSFQSDLFIASEKY